MTTGDIEIDLAKVRHYEVGAALVALLALPDGDEYGRGSLIVSICNLVLKGEFLAGVMIGHDEQSIKPLYAFRSDDELRRDLKTIRRLLRDRMIAAQMALPLLMRAEGTLPAKLPEGLRKLTLDELALWAVAKAPMGDEPDRIPDSSNIETRIWRPSLPVIHIAAALAVIMQETSREGRGEIDIGQLLTQRWIAERVAALGEQFAELIQKGGVLPGQPVQLIRFRLVGR